MAKTGLIFFIMFTVLIHNENNIYSVTEPFKEKTFSFTYGLKIKRKEKEFQSFRVYIPLPSEKYGQKLIINKKNILPDNILIRENLGLKYLYYNIGKNLNNNSEVIISLDVDLTKKEKKINFSAPPVNPDLAGIASQNKYLESNYFINFKNRDIQNIAKKLKGNSVINTAYNVFNYVKNKLKVKRRFEGLIPLDRVLNQGNGECSDFATFFVAIMRSLKVPARHVIGRVMRTDEAKSFHVWAEFYDKNYGWIPVDPFYYKWNGKLLFGYEPLEFVVIHKGINISLPLGEIKQSIPILQTYYYFYSSKYGKIDFNISYIWSLKKK